MKFKRGATPSPIIDFWSIVIYCLLLIVFMSFFFVIGGCEKSFSTAEIRSSESNITSDYLLLNFLKIPLSDNLNEIPGENNVADLIILAQNNLAYTNQFKNYALGYFSQNYYEGWRIRVIYPLGADIIDYNPNDIRDIQMKRTAHSFINTLTSSTFSKIKDNINYNNIDEIKTSIIIPSTSPNPIHVELYIETYPSYPIFHNFNYRDLTRYEYE